MLGGGIHTVKKNIETLIVVGKKVGLQENTEDAKYMAMPWYQENQNTNVGNKPFESVQ